MSTCISDHAFITIAGAAAVLFAADAYLMRQIREFSQDVIRMERSTVRDLGGIRQEAAKANNAHHDGIEALAAELVAVRYETTTAAGGARTDAERYAERLAKSVVESRRIERRWVDTELTNVRKDMDAANESTLRLARELREARAASAATRTANAGAATRESLYLSDIDALKRIAANHRDELAARRASAARDIFEFAIKKTGKPKELAGVSILLLQADSKRSRYSVEIVAGGRKIEANNRTAHEPVRLYTGSRAPLELVVNEIRKDEILGFVSVPRRPQVARNYSIGRTETDGFPAR
jgi:hypothetical protein